MHTGSMLRPLLSCLIVVFASAALADECALDTKAITAQFSAKLPKGAKVLSTKKEKRKVKQVLKLADGVEVTVDFGGCERVQYSFGIKAKGLTTKTVGAEAMAVARRVLPGPPLAGVVAVQAFVAAEDGEGGEPASIIAIEPAPEA